MLLLDIISSKEKDDKSWDNYQEIKIQYNDELEKIKTIFKKIR